MFITAAATTAYPSALQFLKFYVALWMYFYKYYLESNISLLAIFYPLSLLFIYNYVVPPELKEIWRCLLLLEAIKILNF